MKYQVCVKLPENVNLKSGFRVYTFVIGNFNLTLMQVNQYKENKQEHNYFQQVNWSKIKAKLTKAQFAEDFITFRLQFKWGRKIFELAHKLFFDQKYL